MALPGDLVPPDGNWLTQKIWEHDQAITELRAARSAEATTIGKGGLRLVNDGSITMLDAADVQRLFIGHTDFWAGFDQPVVFLRDANGKIRFGLFDPNPADGYQPVVWIFDHKDRAAFTTDINGGVAEPWISVPIYPKAYPSTFLDSLGTDLTVPVSACNGSAIWEGRIGKVSHPKIQYDGVFGRVTGSSGSPTYTFKVDDVTKDSFTQTGYGAERRGPFDISSLLGRTDVVVQLTVSATGTGTDRIAAQPNACYLRQT